MSADSAVTYTSVHSEARSWSIPSEDPYKEAARQLLEQASRSLEYVPDPIELEDHVPLHIPKHPEDLVPAEDEAYILKVASAPTPPLPPSFLSLHIRPLHTRAVMAQMRAVVPHRAEIPKADMLPRKRLLLTPPRPGCKVGESSVAAAARQPGPTTARSEDRAAVRAEIEVLRRERLSYKQESIQIYEALTKSKAYSRTLEARVAVLKTQVHRHEWQRQTADDFAVQHIMRTQALEAGARIDILEDTSSRVAAVMAEAEASRVRNGYGSNGSGPRLAQTVRECTYPYFLKFQPLNFKGIEGVVGLTQWFKKMESVFNISNCTSACQFKYATFTLQGVALIWGEIKKLETEMWELKTKGTDVIGYNRRFKEFALMCDRTFPEESDRVEKYIDGLPDTIHDSVNATRPKTMQEAIEFATELIDRKICTFAERQIENKRKQDDNNNQAHQQPLKKQGVAIAYTAWPGERNKYAGTLPLCNKCKFHHNDQCTVKYVNYKRVGHLTRDYRSPAATNNHRNLTCYQCGNQGHYRSDCPELKNQDHANQARGTGARGMEAARQLLKQAPRSPEYVPDPIELEDHIPLHIPEHPEDLVPAEDEAYILESSHGSDESCSTIHLSFTTPIKDTPLLPIPIHVPSTSYRAEIPEADTPPRKRLLLTAPRPGCEVGESFVAAAARQPGPTMACSIDCSFEDRAAVRAEIEVLRRERLSYEQESIQIRKALTKSEAYSRTLEAQVAVLETQAHRHEWKRQTADDFAVQHIMRTQALEAEALINLGVATAMAEAEASRVRNGYGSNGSGPRLAQTVRECTYPDFLKCQPLNFKGTEGVVGLTQWSRSYMVELPCEECYFGSCSGIAMENFEENDDRQEFALMCDQTFLEESDRVEKYIDGLPDMIHDSMKATRPKVMQEAIEFATELIDRKIHTFAERQTKNKRKLDDNNNQAHQQPLKKQGVAIAYTDRPGEKKEYAGTLPLCNKYTFHYNDQCTVKCINCKRVGHLTRDYRSLAATNNHRNPTSYQCGNQGHYISDCPKLKNQDHVNQARGTGARRIVHALEGGETN
nr:hypothetical protein [Tanacetum cinerariifolium]